MNFLSGAALTIVHLVDTVLFFNWVSVLECEVLWKKMMGKCENRDGFGRRRERPARKIMEGSQVVPREGKRMRSQGTP